MAKQSKHLGDLSAANTYSVLLDFTDPMEPSSLCNKGLPFVSVKHEILANALMPETEKRRRPDGGIPYGSPLYVWQVTIGNQTEVLYVGQTVLLTVQKRFEQHASAVKILCEYVNNPDARVHFRLCRGLDLEFSAGNRFQRIGIEHLPLTQAKKVVDDIEAHLIFKRKPRYNTLLKNDERKCWKPFQIEDVRKVDLP